MSPRQAATAPLLARRSRRQVLEGVAALAATLIATACALKDTVLVEPMQRLAIDWVSDNPGNWAFHCHNLYHQEAGMMRVVQVR